MNKPMLKQDKMLLINKRNQGFLQKSLGLCAHELVIFSGAYEPSFKLDSRLITNNLIHPMAYPKGHKREVTSQRGVAQHDLDIYKLIELNFLGKIK